MAQAVKITSENQHNAIIDILKEKGYKPFQLGATYRNGYISIEPRYIQMSSGNVYLKNYELISFEDFIK